MKTCSHLFFKLNFPAAFKVHRKGVQLCSTLLCLKILQDYETSYPYKLDSLGPVHQNQQQIR